MGMLAVYENMFVSILDSPIRLGVGDMASASWDTDHALPPQLGSHHFPMDGERLVMHTFCGRADVIGSKAILDSCPVVKPERGTTCAICIDDADDDCSMRWRKVPCGHVYHERCLAELIKLPHRRSCPLCRFDLAN